MDGSLMYKKGEVYIRTKFREQHQSEYSLSRQEMMENEDWREAVGAEGRAIASERYDVLLDLV